MASIPSFDPGEVQLLISAVQDALQDLKNANEKLGGNDSEMIEAGRRYAIVLQKLQLITSGGTT